MFLKILQNSQENTHVGVPFLTVLQTYGNFIKKETLKQLFSCKFSEIFKNTFPAEQLQAPANRFNTWNTDLKY